jgi:hypothetical protein
VQRWSEVTPNPALQGTRRKRRALELSRWADQRWKRLEHE